MHIEKDTSDNAYERAEKQTCWLKIKLSCSNKETNLCIRLLQAHLKDAQVVFSDDNMYLE